MKLTIPFCWTVEQMEKSLVVQTMEIVHTREMNVRTAACVRHNYIMRCTLAHLRDLRRTRPRECNVYPWEPVMRWWSRFPTLRRWLRRDMYVGGCASLSVGMIRVHWIPHGFCQHRQYATARWTNVDESGPVGTEVLVMFDANEDV